MFVDMERILGYYLFQLSRKLEGRLLGPHTYIQPGDGYEIRDFRPYEPGDSFRDIDHKQTAKHGSLQVRRMFADREVDVWLLLDVRRAMRLGAARSSKFSHALHMLMMGYAWSHGVVSRLGAIRLGAEGQANDEANRREPRQGRPYALQTLDWLRLSSSPVPNRHQPLSDSLQEATKIIRRPGVVFVATDMSESAIYGPLADLAERHEVILIGVRDAVDDLTLPLSGWTSVEDADSEMQGTGLITSGSHKAAAKQVADELDELEKRLSDLPLSYLKVYTEENPLERFVGFARNHRYGGNYVQEYNQERRRSA